jgi:hypothetical protein
MKNPETPNEPNKEQELFFKSAWEKWQELPVTSQTYESAFLHGVITGIEWSTNELERIEPTLKNNQ